MAQKARSQGSELCPYCGQEYSLAELVAHRQGKMFECDRCRQFIYFGDNLKLIPPVHKKRGPASGKITRSRLMVQRAPPLDDYPGTQITPPPSPVPVNQPSDTGAHQTSAQKTDRLTKCAEWIERAVADRITLVGRYRLDKMIGRGASGIVIMAYDLEIRSEVALKIHLETMLEGKPGEAVKKRVRRTYEIQTLFKSKHVNQPLGIHDDPNFGLFTVEPVIRGLTLREVFEQRYTKERGSPAPFNEASVVSIGLQVTEVLIEAAEHGVIHRDVKPENLMVSEETVLLVDWGVARVNGVDQRDQTGLMDDSDLEKVEDKGRFTTITAANTIIGTPHYMSPEQVKGERVTSASDVWCLGATLYHMATAELPFLGETIPKLCHAIVYTPNEPARKWAGVRSDGTVIEISDRLNRLLNRCLEKEPDRRPSPREMRDELRACERALKEHVSPYTRMSKLAILIQLVVVLFMYVACILFLGAMSSY